MPLPSPSVAQRHNWITGAMAVCHSSYLCQGTTAHPSAQLEFFVSVCICGYVCMCLCACPPLWFVGVYLVYLG